MNVLVVSDTHLRESSVHRLPTAVLTAAEAADVILHAGDITEAAVLERLASFAPLHAVLGNNDKPALAEELPETQVLEIVGVTIAMVHDSGARVGRAARMKKRFPTADVVVFGHSHDPVDEVGADGQLLFNPGSPTQRRRQPVATYGWLRLVDGAVAERSIVPVG